MDYKCPKCGKIFNRSENSIKKRPYILCKSCTTLETTKNPIKQAEALAKKKATCLKKYGVDNPAKSDTIKEKSKNTCIEKYGVKSPLCLNENKKNIDFAERGKSIKKTMIERYGGCTYASKELNEKVQKTCMERYGVKVYGGSKEWKESVKNALISKFGSIEDAYKHIREKCNITNLEKYGFENTWMLASKTSILYDGIYFDSKPEVEFYKFFKNLGYNVIFEPTYFEYYTGNKKHRYFPDFEINGQYYEIKGDHMLNDNDELIDFYGDKKVLREKTDCMRKNNIIMIRASMLDDFLNNFKAGSD